jgi:hypothetical protein
MHQGVAPGAARSGEAAVTVRPRRPHRPPLAPALHHHRRRIQISRAPEIRIQAAEMPTKSRAARNFIADVSDDGQASRARIRGPCITAAQLSEQMRPFAVLPARALCQPRSTSARQHRAHPY